MRIPVLLTPLISTLASLALALPASAASDRGNIVRPPPAVVIATDFAQTNVHGPIRGLNGVNKGPIAPGGLVDLTKSTELLNISSTRLHDCHWPTPDVVDFHAVFPNPDADPSKIESYDFRLTDLYLNAIITNRSDIVYRLGETIEHSKVKRFVHPPKDIQKWTEICLGIIRHYNEGWTNGRHNGIKYWEIWNEPENRPVMWSGNDDDYCRLYAISAKIIKGRYPNLKIGGPAAGWSGKYANGDYRPSDFTVKFLERCRRESIPLDFFSWHCYTTDTTELTGRAKAVRKLLDSYGFTRTESHLNEWNYCPWNEDDSTAEKRDVIFGKMSGSLGAAFIAAGILELEDTPVDVCNLFHGEIGAMGIFSEQGAPMKNYHALHAFRCLLDHPQRVKTEGNVPGKLAAVAGLNTNRTEAAVLISNFSEPQKDVYLKLAGLPWAENTTHEIRLVDPTHNLEPIGKPKTISSTGTIYLSLPAPSVALVTLRAASNPFYTNSPSTNAPIPLSSTNRHIVLPLRRR